MLKITFGIWLLSFLYAPVHNTWLLALVVGGVLTGINLWAIKVLQHERWTTAIIAVVFMLMVSLHVHQLQGMIEAHFGYFVVLAILFVYMEYRPLLWGAVAAAVLHVVLHLMQHAGFPVYLFPDGMHSWTIVGMHALYVVLETGILLVMMRLSRRMLNASRELVVVTTTMLGDDENTIDLKVRANDTGNPILGQLNWVLESLEKAIQEANHAYNAAHENLDHLTHNSQDVMALSQQSRDAIRQIRVAMDDMNASFVEVAQQTQRSAGLVSDTQAAQKAGQDTVQQQRTGIQALSQVLTETGKTIESVADDCQAVTKTLTEIQGIAEQTNLLALNAAIEAARAGEQGRGFAVVADEVRALASRTQNSTANIRSIIDRLVSGSQSAVTAMRASQTRVDENVAHSEQVEQVFQQIGGALEDISAISQQIAVATEEQTQVSGGITSQAGNIDEISTRTTAKITESGQRTDALDRTFKDLATMLRRFD
ncbi:methyl-accepting chemotaxis protein [Salinispirillum marinum]|uniref:Methyl-accepting chemotaxis protein n=2 Tax=Saccharospirillaceae TaxID=255527 RepID=A0ABV8BBV2_9GAMM